MIQQNRGIRSAVTSISLQRRLNTDQSTSLRFVDLFAGLGGFHVALSRLGHRCVLASEIQPELAQIYEQNFGIRAQGDIRGISLSDIPGHDILCAGFPCQPFSKAGMQLGTDCPEYGDLALRIVEWLRQGRPHYFILENVPNLVRHRSGHVWRRLGTDLRQAGYDVRFAILSPHQFGVPQIRDRLYVVGSRSGLDGFEWPSEVSGTTDIRSVLDEHPVEAKPLSKKVIAAIDAWSTFTQIYPKEQPKPWFPIWAAEFGATYPFAIATPSELAAATLREYRGSFGLPLAELRGKALNAAIPPYSRANTPKFPSWKVKFIQLNRELYKQNRSWIDQWKNSLDAFEPSFQKLEWNFERDSFSLWDTILQLRGSGIRAKSPSSAPALVAMSSSQVPIVGWERRYMTVKECARLQGLEDLQHLPKTETAAHRALGNAVSVKMIELIAKQLLATARVSNSQMLSRRKRA